jgi:hypothetical protein
VVGFTFDAQAAGFEYVEGLVENFVRLIVEARFQLLPENECNSDKKQREDRRVDDRQPEPKSAGDVPAFRQKALSRSTLQRSPGELAHDLAAARGFTVVPELVWRRASRPVRF